MRIRKFSKINLYEDILLPIIIITYVLSLTVLAKSVSGEGTSFAVFLKLLRYVVYGVCVIRLPLENWKIKTIIVSFFFIIVIGWSFIYTRNTELLCFLIVAFALRDVPYEKILRQFFIYGGVTVIIIMLLSQVGVIEDYVRVEKMRGNRHFLGFVWATTGPTIVMFYSWVHIALKHGKITFFEMALWDVIAVILYRMTGSRFAFLAIIGTTLFFWLIKNKYIYKVVHFFEPIMFIVPWICWGISYYLCANYDVTNPVMFKINKLLSSRLVLGNLALKNYSVYWLKGQNISWKEYSAIPYTSFENVFVDNAYVRFMIEYGIFFIIILVSIYSLAIIIAYKNNNYWMLWILTIVSIFGMLESWLLNPPGNPFNWCIVYFLEKGYRSYKDKNFFKE